MDTLIQGDNTRAVAEEDGVHETSKTSTTLLSFPFSTHSSPSEQPQKLFSELSMLCVDQSLRDFFQTETRLQDIVDKQEELRLAAKKTLEARIFSCFVVYFRKLAPKSLRQAISLTKDWMSLANSDGSESARKCILLSKLTTRYNTLVKAGAYSFIASASESFGSENGFSDKGREWRKQYLETSRRARDEAFSSPPGSHQTLWYMNPEMEEFDQSYDVVQKVAEIVEDCDEKCHDEGLFLVLVTSCKLAEMYRQPDFEHVFPALVAISLYATEALKTQGPITTQVLEIGRAMAAAYEQRFERSGSSTCLDAAIKGGEDFIKMFEEEKAVNHLESTTSFLSFQSNLGRLYGRRFFRSQENHPIDLRTAFVYAELALSLSSPEIKQVADIRTPEQPDLHKHEIHGNYGALLRMKFGLEKSEAVLEDCIKQYRTAIEASKDISSLCQRHGIYSLNLASAYTAQFSWFPDKHARENHSKLVFELLKVADEALLEAGPSLRAELYSTFRDAYITFAVIGSDDDGHTIFNIISCCRKGWRCNGANPALRLELAILAARNLAVIGMSSNIIIGVAFSFIEEVVTQLPLLATLSSDVADSQYLLSKRSGYKGNRLGISGLGGLAASLALQANETAFKAVEMLEGSRAIISGQLLDFRADVSVLEKSHPVLATKFETVTMKLESGKRQGELIYQPKAWYTKLKGRVDAEIEFRELLVDIRTRKGFENFLISPTERSMKELAGDGAIVMLSSSMLQSNALIINHNRVWAIELPGISDNRVQELNEIFKLYGSRSATTEDITPLLRELWLHVAKPVLDALGFCDAVTDSTWPRVWWVPTGSFTGLPLHAAGIHQLDSKESVIDRVVSSYTPTVKALANAHQAKQLDGSSWNQTQAVLVAMPTTPDADCLTAVSKEVADIKPLWESNGLVVESLINQTKSRVLEHLETCDIFHFAGHGRAHLTDPFRSELLLQDYQHDLLTVSDLRDFKRQGKQDELMEWRGLRRRGNLPSLAYLSACVTSVNDAGDLVDEGIHIAGALQLAGFRHVIGTLWEVSDEQSVDVAREFYENLLSRGKTDEAVAVSLHKSIRKLRRSYFTDEPEAKALMAGGSEPIHSQVTSDGPTRGERGAGEAIFGQAERRTNPQMYWIPYIHSGP